MKIFILALFFQSAYAAFPIIDVQDLNGIYENEQGIAHAIKANYVLPKVEISHEDIDVKFNKEQKKLKISDPSTSVILDFDFSFLNIFKSFEFNGVEIKSTDKLFWVQSDILNLFINNTAYNLNEFYIETDVRNIPTQDDEDITVVDGLILNAILNIKTARFRNVEREEFFEDLKLENPEKIEQINELANQEKGIPLVVRNVSYVVKEGVFNGKALLDSWINLWLRVNGKMTTDKDNSNLTIHLQRAKLGIFSIKGTLLKRVRNLQLEGVQVVKDKIIVNLETVVLGDRENTKQSIN